MYCGLCNLTNVFFLSLVGIYIIAALLHPSEFWCVPSGLIYYLYMPTMFILLNIYSFMNLHVNKWGTREEAAASEEAKKQMNQETSR